MRLPWAIPASDHYRPKVLYNSFMRILVLEWRICYRERKGQGVACLKTEPSSERWLQMTCLWPKMVLAFVTSGLLLAFLSTADDTPSKSANSKATLPKAPNDKNELDTVEVDSPSTRKKKREYKGMLPQFWKQLGLTKEQTEKNICCPTSSSR